MCCDDRMIKLVHCNTWNMRKIQHLMLQTQREAIFFNCSHTPMVILDKRRHLSAQLQKQPISSRSLAMALTQHKKSLFRLKFMRSEGKSTVIWASDSLLFLTWT